MQSLHQASPAELEARLDAELRVAVALCRPFSGEGSFATPTTNQDIADELMISVAAVKTHLRALFRRFGNVSEREP